MIRASRYLSAAVLSTLVSCAIMGSSERPGSPKIDGLGNHTWTITTRSPEAQALFNQGVKLFYAFDHSDAARSFRAALEADPACAMCAWGLAYAMGPNVNNSNPADRKESARFQARAEKLAKDVAPLELAIITAARGRYVSVGKDDDGASEPVAKICSSSTTKVAPAFDLAYAQRMQSVHAQFPSHPDVATLYADAELITDAWKWWNAEGKPTAATERGVAALEGVLKNNREHTGANHLLIHAIEQSRTPERAVASADLLRSLAGGAPHLLHMPSHIYIKTGRFADATLANETALAADDKREEIVKAQGFEARPSWRTHHLHFLQYAAMMDGRSEISINAATKLAVLSSGKSARGGDRSGVYSQYMHSLARLNQARFQQWDVIIAAPAATVKGGIEEGIARYTRGLAQVARGSITEADVELKEIRRLAAIDKNRKAKLFGEYEVSSLLQVAAEALDGQLKLKLQKTEDGIAALQRAVKLESAIDADDPPLLGAHTRLMLARALLAAGRNAEAETVARDDLKAVPGSGWALSVLRDTLRAQKKMTEAAEIEKKLRDVWARADAALKS
jgi:tetratricopeptide (TPR) repeat protein